jgi:hypothetical protein
LLCKRQCPAAHYPKGERAHASECKPVYPNLKPRLSNGFPKPSEIHPMLVSRNTVRTNLDLAMENESMSLVELSKARAQRIAVKA